MHMEKFGKNAAPNILDHNGRSDSERKPNRSNELIDPTRSHLNYNLAASTQPLPALDFFKERLKEINIHGNASVYMLGWIITVPKNLPESEHKIFFKSAYDFFVNQYGERNVISAYVHMDETTPHMHYMTIPVVEGKKGEKLAAKEITTRAHLNMMHPAMEAYVSNELGHHVDIINGATKEGNKSIKEFKAGKAKEDLEKAKVEAERVVAEATRKAEEITAEREIGRAEHEFMLSLVEKGRDDLRDFETKGFKEYLPTEEFPDGFYKVPKRVVETQFMAYEMAEMNIRNYKKSLEIYERNTHLEKENRRLVSKVLQFEEKVIEVAEALKAAKEYIARIGKVLTEIANHIPNFRELFNQAVATVKREEDYKSIPISSFNEVDIDDYVR